MAKQVRNPFCVLDIGFAPRNLLNVLSVGHDDLQRSFQNRVDRFPIHARAFHGDMRASFSQQPFAQAQQLARGSAERPHLLLHLPVVHHISKQATTVA